MRGVWGECGSQCNGVRGHPGAHYCSWSDGSRHREIEVQTNISLPHSLRDILWTPAGMEPALEATDESEQVADARGEMEDDERIRVGQGAGDMGALTYEDREDTNTHEMILFMVILLMCLVMIWMNILVIHVLVMFGNTIDDVLDDARGETLDSLDVANAHELGDALGDAIDEDLRL